MAIKAISEEEFEESPMRDKGATVIEVFKLYDVGKAIKEKAEMILNHYLNIKHDWDT